MVFLGIIKISLSLANNIKLDGSGETTVRMLLNGLTSTHGWETLCAYSITVTDSV